MKDNVKQTSYEPFPEFIKGFFYRFFKKWNIDGCCGNHLQYLVTIYSILVTTYKQYFQFRIEISEIINVGYVFCYKTREYEWNIDDI